MTVGALMQHTHADDVVDPPSVFAYLSEPNCRTELLNFTVELFASGFNGALKRKPKFEVKSCSLISETDKPNTWKPFWPKMKTFRLTFPEGLDFLQSASESTERERDLRSLQGPRRVAETESAYSERPDEQPQLTRLQPPANSLSLEDRLFYVLQPPLQSWLAGQELVMPFEPFPFQYEGIAWLFSQQTALLADEMGLGKTMQAITAVRLLLRSGQIRSVLLLCPKPLIPNWQREFKLWAEELPVVTIEGDASHRRMLWTMPNVPIRLANYELLVRDVPEVEEEDVPRFDLVVLDEAQRIKNRDSLTAATVRSVPRKRSWALTGTPIENRPEEIASLYEFMEVIPSRGTPDLRQLVRLSKRHVLRRTKDMVLTDLPPRLDRDAHLELTPAQKLAYQVAEKDGVIHLNELGESITVQHVFELILRLKQITNFDPRTGESAKLDRLEADLEEIASTGGKAILFSQWTKTLDWLQQRLQRFGPLVYHGGVPTKKREPILEQFREDPRAHLLLMSYGTGAVGLNLQFAGYVFLFDRWWNPAVEDQAINRAHRIGQKNPVIVTKFITKDTIEERIDYVLQQKRELFAAILGEGEHLSDSLSLNAQEIFSLFDLKARNRGEQKSDESHSSDESQSTAA